MTTPESAARAVAGRLRQHGHIAYFAGGCVRDRLLGHPPEDFDVATDAPADVVQRLFPRTVPVGAQFGVVLVLTDSIPTEVATFRTDDEYLDGRRPSGVRFSSPEEDAQRRDFTINGMFWDPADDRIIDYVGGQADLAAGVIRAIGDAGARIREDRLRMMRAVRFASRLGFRIDSATLEGIRAAAHEIVGIAWERIGDEIVRMLAGTRRGCARRAVELLDSTGLLVHVLPEISALKGCAQSPDYHPEGDVYTHTLLLLEQLEGATETLALGALLHDIAKPATAGTKGDRITFYGHCERGAPMAGEVCRRLRRSRDTWERVEYLVRCHLKPNDAKQMRISTLRRFLADDGIEELLALAELDARASNGDVSDVDFCRARLAELGGERTLPPPLLSGRDLIALGEKPSARFREILSRASELQLEGTLTTRDAALAWLRDQIVIH